MIATLTKLHYLVDLRPRSRRDKFNDMNTPNQNTQQEEQGKAYQEALSADEYTFQRPAHIPQDQSELDYLRRENDHATRRCADMALFVAAKDDISQHSTTCITEEALEIPITIDRDTEVKQEEQEQQQESQPAQELSEYERVRNFMFPKAHINFENWARDLNMDEIQAQKPFSSTVSPGSFPSSLSFMRLFALASKFFTGYQPSLI